MLIAIKGAGDLATGIACRLHRCGFQIVCTDIEKPTTVRCTVAFSRAVYDGAATVTGVTARLAKDAADARLELVGVEPQERSGGAQQHDVGRTGRGLLLGDGIDIDQDRMFALPEFSQYGLRFGVVVDVYERRSVGDHPALRIQVGYVAQRLHRFERDDDIGRALGDQVGEDLVRTDAQVRLYVASALAHAMYFCLFDVESLLEGSGSDDGGDREDALSSHAGKYDVPFHGRTTVFLRCGVWRSGCTRGAG